MDIPIRIHNGDTALVTFTGVGYDKRVLGDTMPLSDEVSTACVPAIQSAPVPGQLCYLSQERLAFGNLPLFSRARRIVTMLNHSTHHPVAYQWHVTAKGDTQVRKIIQSQLWIFISLTPLRARFLRENINIYLHFLSFLHTDKTQVVEILPRVRQGPAYST